MSATARINVPIVTRLLLSEIAERRGKSDQEFLTELIRREAIAEMRRTKRESDGKRQ